MEMFDTVSFCFETFIFVPSSDQCEPRFVNIYCWEMLLFSVNSSTVYLSTEEVLSVSLI